MATTSKRSLEAHRKRQEAAEMRLADFTLQQIADQLYNGHRANAHRALSVYREKAETKTIAEMRDHQNEQLAAVVQSFWSDMRRGDTAAGLQILRTLKRVADLNGLDAPTQVEQLGDGVVHVHFDPLVKPAGMLSAEVEVTDPDA